MVEEGMAEEQGMALTGLDHVNMRTTDLERMVRFYEDVLGMKSGAHPRFRMGGAWLYLGDSPVVHIVVSEAARPPDQPQLEHFAFRAKGLAATIAQLEAHGVEFRLAGLESFNITQIFLRDPDGNAVELQFAGEAAPASGAE
jgi:catechol 2,3-dioxygenase-like lactoylglutathione lyase family enzyme